MGDPGRSRFSGLIGYYNYTVVLTYAGLAGAVLGILLAADGQATAAVCCLLFAGLCDMFDGTVAHTMDRTKDEQSFGIQIDSLCDLVDFGVLPAMIGLAMGNRHWSYYLVAILYVLCGMIRLAYYNVTEEERQSRTNEKRREYLGLPISGAALILGFAYCLIRMTGAGAAIYGVVLLATAAAFVTPFRMPKPGIKTMLVFLLLGVAMLVYMLCQ